MIGRAWIAAVIYLAGSGAAMAEDALTGRSIQNLYQTCKSVKATDTLTCLGYLHGTAALMETIGAVATGTGVSPSEHDALLPFAICIKDTSVSVGQMRQVFINWAEKHPEKWQDDQAIGAWHAFHEAWGCHQ